MKTNQQHGLVLVELLFYVVVAVLLLGAIVYFLFTAYWQYSELVARAQADRIGASTVNQLVRDTRSGVSVVVGSSNFAVPLSSVTIERAEGDRSYYVNNGILYEEDAGSSAEALNPDTHTISRFYIEYLTTPVSMGLRYEVGVTYDTREGTNTKYYTGVALLRESYE